jgi:hypothetical protein
MHLAYRRADGTFEYDGDLYRIEDRQRDHFAVCRIRDDKVVGGLRFASDSHEAETEVDGPAAELDVVRAIGKLLGQARGLVPLQ